MTAGLQCWDENGDLILDTSTITFVIFYKGTFYYTKEMLDSNLDEHELTIINPLISKAKTRILPIKFWYSEIAGDSFIEKQDRLSGYRNLPWTYAEPLIEIVDGAITLKYQKKYFDLYKDGKAAMAAIAGYDFVLGNDLDDDLF